jgi:hypothetical protein
MPIDAGRRRFADWVVDSEFPLTELPATTTAADWRIVADPSVFHQRHCRWYHKSDATDGLPWVWYGRSGDDDVLRLWGQGLVVARRAQREIACLWRRCLGAAEHQHLLINHVLPTLASSRGFLIGHASVAVRPSGGAVAIMGPVGAGKSTMTSFLVSKGWGMLSDDRLVVDRNHRVWPVSNYVRLSPTAAERLGYHAELPDGHHKVRVKLTGASGAPAWSPASAPLERVILLERGEGALELQAVAPGAAVQQILSSVLQLGMDLPSVRAGLFAAVADVVSAVRVDRLKCPRDWNSLTAAEQLLLQGP